MSSVTKYARYYTLYAAAAVEGERRDLDAQGCRELLRRAEVLLAAVQIAQSPGGIPDGLFPHGHDGVYPRLSADDGLDLDRTARVYSPRSWGFWSQYGAPAQVLGIVGYDGGRIRPGRHECPAEVRELFAPLLALAGSRRTEVRPAELQEAGAAALGQPCAEERDWLGSLLTATRDGIHRSEEWQATDRTRRATLRVLARAVALHGGDSYTGALRETVAFGTRLTDDPVLSAAPEAARWRGLLLRHYSVSAWRRLWADLVTEVGMQDGQDGGQDMSAAELRAWLCDQVPDGTVNEALAGLGPAYDRAGHSVPIEPRLLEEKPAPWRDIRVLLAGGLRARDGADGTRPRPGNLFAGVQRAFLGDRREFLDPMWVEALMREYGDRPVRDLASRLADDMLAQSRRVALRKLRYDPQTGGLKIFSRLHMRNDRYFRIGEESKAEIGIRIPQLGSIGRQLGLFEADAGEAGSLTLTGAARTSLDVVA